jgi:glutamine synthetase
MDPKNTGELSAARQYVVDRGLEGVKVGVFDVNGILRGKYLSRDKFLSALLRDHLKRHGRDLKNRKPR